MNITLCTDLDNTLLPNGRQVSDPHSIDLLHRLIRQQHITLIYVSGRDKRLVLDAISEYDLPLPQYAITDVGTQIHRIDSSDDANFAKKHAKNSLLWQEDLHWQQHLQKGWDAEKLNAVKNKLQDYSHLHCQEPEKQSRFKLSYYLDTRHYESDIKQDVENICQQTGIKCNVVKSYNETTSTGLLDVLPADASKYHAIRFLMDKHAITEKEILFCGDSGNDLDVLTSEIPAVLVNNAQTSVKQRARQLADKHHHNAQLYIAKGNFCGLNGYYCSGILEGLAYYYPEFKKLICENIRL